MPSVADTEPFKGGLSLNNYERRACDALERAFGPSRDRVALESAVRNMTLAVLRGGVDGRIPSD